MTTPNVFEMSDEEFLKAGPPEVTQENAEQQQEQQQQEQPDPADPGAETTSGDAGGGSADDTQKNGGDTDKEASPGGEASEEAGAEGDKPAVQGDDKSKDQPKAEPKTVDEALAALSGDKAREAPKEAAKEQPKDALKPEAKDALKEGEQSKPQLKMEDKAKAYDLLMAPLKANGKTFELKDPAEAVKLMQLGANYGKHMQQLAPARKLVKMLHNSGVDENQLSFLLDIHQKKPDAIARLLKDANIDPMEVDIGKATEYRPGYHKVSDAEVTFQTALDDVQSREGGGELVLFIDRQWDAQSKQALWDNPQILTALQSAKEEGVWDIIYPEIERRRTLGTIGPEVPFLQAWKIVGDELSAQEAAQKQQQEQQQGKPAGEGLTETNGGGANQGQDDQPGPLAQLVTERVAAPKPDKDGDKAKSAGTPRAKPTPAKVLVNPLDMDDKEFEEKFGKIKFS